MDTFKQSKEMFINMDKKDIPYWDNRKFFWEQTKSAIQFFQNEYYKIHNGVNLGGYYMTGWMYFHINFFQTTIIDPNTLRKSIKTPPLDDNTYYLMECYKEAVEKGLGLCMWGTRGFAKSTFIGSIKHWTHLTKDGTSMLVYKEGNDLSSIRDMITTSMSNIHHAFKLNILRGSGDWKDTDVVFGNSTSHNEEFIKSQLRVINANGGAESASERGAGLTPIGYVMDEIGKFNPTGIFEAAKASFKYQNKSLFTYILAGCVCAGTKIWTNDGKTVNIEDLNPEEGILGFDVENNKISKEEITYWQPPHEKPCYRIETNRGRILECSDDHPIYVRDKYENGVLRRNKYLFKEAKDLVKGDQVCVSGAFDENMFGDQDMFDPYLTGMLIGDGTYSKTNSAKLFNADKEVLDYVKNKYKTSIFYSAPTKDGRTLEKLTISGITDELRKLGIKDQARETKTLPVNLHTYKREDILDMLAGLYDADGCVFIGKKIEKTKQKQGTTQEMVVKLTSYNRTILEEVRLVLQKFGIQANLVYERLTENSSAKSTRGHYNLLIKSRSNLLKFAKLLPMRIGYKKENLKTIVDILTPLVKEDKNNFEHESVKSVEYIGLKPVYNLTAGTTNTYIANGIITHNTGGNETLSEGAKTMLLNPEDYDLLIMNWDLLNNMVPDEHITWKEDVGRKFGIFVPGQMSYRENEPKLEKTFGEFTKNEFKSEELNLMKINVTDWKATKEKFQEKLDSSSDETVKTNQRMYYPMCIDDSFLTSKVNPFNSEAITRKLRQLKEKPKHTLVDFEIDPKTNKINTIFQSDKPLAERGYKKTISAPYMIFDNFPKEVPPKFKFVSGADDYKSADATTESLGSIYVLERRTINMPLEKIAGCLVERPTTHREMHAKWEKLIRGTQAICNLEAADTAFVSYLEDVIKVDAYQYLHPFINPHAALANKKKGKVASNYRFGTYPHQWNVKILLDTVLDYTQQTFTVGFDPDTNAQIVNCGIDLIDDPMLLQEMLDFKYGSGNYDRLFSFGWALILARHLDSKNIMPEDKHVEKYNKDTLYKQRRSSINFGKPGAKNF